MSRLINVRTAYDKFEWKTNETKIVNVTAVLDRFNLNLVQRLKTCRLPENFADTLVRNIRYLFMYKFN